MKIENLRSEENGNLARVAATVIWEDCDRPTQEIYFETTTAFAQGLSCNPHAFLVACIMPAMRHGEERVSINAEICPELRNGLITAMSWIRHWYEPDRKPVQIEAKTKSHLPMPHTPERAGLFLSGGIDSLATLRVNRLNFPVEHPGSFKDGFLIHGIEKGKDLELFKQAVSSLSIIALDADISLIPVYTNIRHLDYDSSFWGKEFQGAALSAVAHTFSRRLTTVAIPSSFDISHLYPYGSHPLLDPNYSSSDLQIRHDSILLSRLTKTKLVADWDVALQNIRVCNKPKLIKTGTLNCGQCEKCLRTMLALLALGMLDKTRAFPEVDISEELILANAYIKYPPYAEFCYRELIVPLAAKGRLDLVRAIERLIAQYHTESRLKQREERLKQIDRKFLKGNLFKFCKAVALKA